MLVWLHPPVVCGGSRLVGGEPERDADANGQSDAAAKSECDGYTGAAARAGGGCFAESRGVAGGNPRGDATRPRGRDEAKPCGGGPTCAATGGSPRGGECKRQ